MRQATHYEKILKELKKAGTRGRTYRDLYVHSNSPWKRIRELETMGVKFIWGKDDNDIRLRRIWLRDPKQERIQELLEYYEAKRKAG